MEFLNIKCHVLEKCLPAPPHCLVGLRVLTLHSELCSSVRKEEIKTFPRVLFDDNKTVWFDIQPCLKCASRGGSGAKSPCMPSSRAPALCAQS